MGLALLAASVVLYGLASLPANPVQAASEEGECAAIGTPKPTKEEKRAPATEMGQEAPGTIHMLCGKLVYITYVVQKHPQQEPVFLEGEKIHTIGLIPCTGSSLPYIFKVKPLDLVYFYQFRDAVVSSGKKVCTKEYGCLNLYITSFKNYVGMDRCSDCGKYNMPPTWTHVPLTPFTATPIPPTQPLILPSSPTPTETPTATPGSPTPGLFAVLYDTPTPAPPASPTATLLPPPTALPPVGEVARGARFSPLWLGLLLLLGVLLLAYWGWRSAARSDWE
jgi:hypothetical protein